MSSLKINYLNYFLLVLFIYQNLTLKYKNKHNFSKLSKYFRIKKNM